MQSSTIYDDAVIGAGILGLAHAYHLARRGRKVIVLERSLRAEGASIRNFGMIWPIGQPVGERYECAMKSREHWLHVLDAAGLWYEHTGSLHLAYMEDEAQVLREFAAQEGPPERGLELLTAEEACARAPWIQSAGLLAALWSPHEMCVDPRQVLAELPVWLAHELNVTFCFGTTALQIENNTIHTSAGEIHAKNIWVCNGDDFHTLYPELFAESGLFRCRQQMLRTQPQPDLARLGPMPVAGLTLLHENAFSDCPTLPDLRERLERELPDYLRLGIHTLTSQTSSGAVTLGCSHEYGDSLDSPFLNGEIEDLILADQRRFLQLPNTAIAERWVGTYAKHSYEPWFVARPTENVTLITGLGGAGLTLSFGLAEKLVHEKLFQTNRIDLVVFDLAGTTVSDSNGMSFCLRDAFYDFGMQVSLPQINQVLGWPKPVAIRHLVENSPLHAERLRDQINMIHANFVTRIKRYYMHDPRVQAISGAAELFRTLHGAGVKVALNTGFSRDITQTILHRLGWRVGETIDAVISSDEVSRGRPFPDMIEALMKRLNIDKARHVAKVGDTPADIEEGHNAGCGLVVGVTYGSHKAEELQPLKPHHLIACLRELPQLLPLPETA